MGTNKTRLWIIDNNATAPIGAQSAVVEFDVYQEAYDYAFAIVKDTYDWTAQNGSIAVWLYSYNNASVRMYWSGGIVVISEIDFPA
jgi:hypothetical protein